MNTPKPTESELEILRVLWTKGPSTVKEVWEELGQTPGYNGVLKLMQMMHEKDLVARDASRRSHVYSAEHNREQTTRRLLRDLKTKVFQGSASKLVLSALTENPVSSEELQEIRELIDQLEKEKGKES